MPDHGAGTVERPLTEMMVRLADLCIARGESPINVLPGCWYIALDGTPTVEVWMNGHREAMTTQAGVTVEPFNAYIEYNGFPWCICTPFGGNFLGSDDVESAVLERIMAATDAATTGAKVNA